MKWARTGIVFAAVLGVSAPAQAAGCPVGLLCAADPAGIVSSLQTQGYKAMLTKSENTGSPRIDSAAAGYAYSILFYGCDDKGAQCTSLGFSTSFSDDGTHTAELANEWNREKRFSVMAIDPADRTLSITYDLSTVGGSTR